MALSEEDKQWISGQLGNERLWMTGQLDSERLWIGKRFDAVSDRLDAQRQWVSERQDLERQWVSDRLDLERQWVGERLEQLETKLLTAFHSWASPSEMRQRSHRLAIDALDSEVELLKEKVKKLEEGK